jgi:signal-transduction protein with cAMP-binding, CBS, and nucleotidyltransferase domain
MTREPILLSEDDELSDALSAMRRHGVRRVMVCTKDGALAGVVSIGDVALAAPIEDAGELLRRVCEPAHKPRRIAQPAIAVARVAS